MKEFRTGDGGTVRMDTGARDERRDAVDDPLDNAPRETLLRLSEERLRLNAEREELRAAKAKLDAAPVDPLVAIERGDSDERAAAIARVDSAYAARLDSIRPDWRSRSLAYLEQIAVCAERYSARRIDTADLSTGAASEAAARAAMSKRHRDAWREDR